MKKIVILLCICCQVQLYAQNVGIKTTTPQSTLDINGDLTLRKGTLNLPAGGNNNVDISTNKYSVYDFAGAALTGGAQIYGFTGGTDGRIITLFNNSTTSGIQLMNENHPGSASSLAANRIVTGSGNSAVIYQNGSVTLRYDGQKQRWTIISSNYTDGLSATPNGNSVWSTLGNNIFNNNAGNVGIGLNDPKAALHIKNELEAIRLEGTSSFISFHDNAGIRKGFLQSTGNNLYLGTPSDNYVGTMQFYLQNNPVITMLPNGNVGIGKTSPAASLHIASSLEALRLDGAASFISFHDDDVRKGFIQVSDYNMYIGTPSNNILGRMQFYLANAPVMTMLPNGNIGIGTTQPTQKLSVNGTIRSKEVIVENINWADYVFDEQYHLKPLNEVEAFIKVNKHLPNIPSAKEIETNGLSIGETQKKMMEKIEELTLYLIEANKQIEIMKKQIDALKK